MTNNNNFVAAAIAAMKENDRSYWDLTLAQRAGLSGQAQGSIYPGLTPEELEERLLQANWEGYSHPAIMEGCKAFRAEIPGALGIVSLAGLPSDTKVVLDDFKATKKVSAVVQGVARPAVDFTVLIVGRDAEDAPWMVWTFHPGDPIRPSQVPAEGLHGKVITVEEALAMGFDFAKIA